jgi:hypothetical protein
LTPLQKGGGEGGGRRREKKKNANTHFIAAPPPFWLQLAGDSHRGKSMIVKFLVRQLGFVGITDTVAFAATRLRVDSMLNCMLLLFLPDLMVVPRSPTSAPVTAILLTPSSMSPLMV